MLTKYSKNYFVLVFYYQELNMIPVNPLTNKLDIYKFNKALAKVKQVRDLGLEKDLDYFIAEQKVYKYLEPKSNNRLLKGSGINSRVKYCQKEYGRYGITEIIKHIVAYKEFRNLRNAQRIMFEL